MLTASNVPFPDLDMPWWVEPHGPEPEELSPSSEFTDTTSASISGTEEA